MSSLSSSKKLERSNDIYVNLSKFSIFISPLSIIRRIISLLKSGKFIDNGEGEKERKSRIEKDQRIAQRQQGRRQMRYESWTLSRRCKRGLLPRQSFHSIPTTMFVSFTRVRPRKFRLLHIKAPPPFSPLPLLSRDLTNSFRLTF